MKLALILAVTGHLLCGAADCLLSYSTKGRLNLKEVQDAKKMSEMFADMPEGFPLASILLGTLAITMFGFGYLAMSRWMGEFSETASKVMYISGLIFLIPIVTHHVFCGVVEWMYIKLGRTDASRTLVFDFQKKTIATMIVGYLGLLVFQVTLFAMVVTGRTPLPVWACVFNTLPLMLALLPTKLPAKGNIAGAVMFAGLLWMI